jgi:Glucose-6-phosphate dehydrogenase, NAD binding domain
MTSDKVGALVIFGATGDLAKLETFPALVGLVDRGLLGYVDGDLDDDRTYQAMSDAIGTRGTAGSLFYTPAAGQTSPSSSGPGSACR